MKKVLSYIIVIIVTIIVSVGASYFVFKKADNGNYYFVEVK